jgi:hypothetical protein
MTITREMKLWTQHSFNVLHVYCRLVDLGISKETAGWLCHRLEFLTKIFYI